MFTTDLYIRIGVNRVLARNLGTGAAAERIPDAAFSHPRMVVGNFTSAHTAVKAAVAKVRGLAFWNALRIVMHPLETIGGGLSRVEEATLRELARGVGAGKVVLWVGSERSDDEARAKLRGE